MRLLRELSDENLARLLVDALHDEGIHSDLREDDDKASVWVHDELDMERAETLSELWLSPDARDALMAAAYRGRHSRERTRMRAEREQRQIERAERAIRQLRRPRPTPLTYAMIALSAGIFVLTDFGDDHGVMQALYIADPSQLRVSVVQLFGVRFPWLHLPWHEPWRLLTPIFGHGDFLHILFNMMWLHGLGTVVERRHGGGYLMAFVVLSGVLSNIAQFEIAQSPAFVGMSGVVYALLGMIWMRGKLDPFVGYALSPFTVQFMLLWLVMGFLAPRFQYANWCHLGGLVVGCAWGALAASRRATPP